MYQLVKLAVPLSFVVQNLVGGQQRLQPLAQSCLKMASRVLVVTLRASLGRGTLGPREVFEAKGASGETLASVFPFPEKGLGWVLVLLG